MTGLVEQIQVLAVNPETSVSALLRIVKLAATKLNLTDTVAWVDKEQTGYYDVDENELPAYRIGSGKLMGENRWMRSQITGDPQAIALCSIVFLRDPISALENLARSEGTTCSMGLSPELEARLQAGMNVGCIISIKFSKSLVISAIDAVRNLALDWALDLEERGISGEGVNFSMDEQQKAATAAPSIRIDHFSGQLHQGNVSGNQNRTVVNSTDNSTNTITTENVLDQLIATIDSSVTHERDREAMLDIVREMDKSKGTPEFSSWLGKLMGFLANYTTVLTPFLPALGQLVG
ncbi:hypothetical protein IWY39_002579 [Sphingobium sp. JAI105]|uniref:AbiTii domain-containing protein n=1 Tax=Sphingobium sp. JAI105 TaxID=2787715 RepID=UPI0018CA7214|nr:hypothetical protein [Sphingobium sp. JAI105]MBG6118775.1 hypothetical protein [Sphingobium sp. JAI105]